MYQDNGLLVFWTMLLNLPRSLVRQVNESPQRQNEQAKNKQRGCSPIHYGHTQ